MSRLSRGFTTIDAVSLLLLILAAAILLAPVHASVRTVEATDRPFVAPTVASPSIPTDEVATIVAANILSASRRAPSSRYASPDRAGPSEFTMPAAFVATPESSATISAEGADAVPSLYGIVSVEGTTRALLRLAESDADPVLLREGDKRGAYRVITIRSNSVIVAGPSGQRTLRLSKPPRDDSTAKQP